ncbi:hypothetical protein [Scandinavium manionii]|nr:hypothetical protein [Scandinavium manionii]MCS2148810.1 hypothetical protein [Scandinavium manionii]
MAITPTLDRSLFTVPFTSTTDFIELVRYFAGTLTAPRWLKTENALIPLA